MSDKMQTIINECRCRAYELCADLDSVELTEDPIELMSALADAGGYFADAAYEVAKMKAEDEMDA